MGQHSGLGRHGLRTSLTPNVKECHVRKVIITQRLHCRSWSWCGHSDDCGHSRLLSAKAARYALRVGATTSNTQRLNRGEQEVYIAQWFLRRNYIIFNLFQRIQSHYSSGHLDDAGSQSVRWLAHIVQMGTKTSSERVLNSLC